jgi:hypothetical protein
MTTVDNQDQVDSIEDWSEEFFKATCGCGFSVETSDVYRGRLALEDHECANKPWISYVFSLWGFFLLCGVGLLVSTIMGG